MALALSHGDYLTAVFLAPLKIRSWRSVKTARAYSNVSDYRLFSFQRTVKDNFPHTSLSFKKQKVQKNREDFYFFLSSRLSTPALINRLYLYFYYDSNLCNSSSIFFFR